MRKVAAAGLLLVVQLTGCADYLNRYDTVTLAAGDTQRANMMLQRKDPFNPESLDTNIPTDGQRTADVMAKYRGSMRGGNAPSSGGDLDCAGGSGNNPVVAGPVAVTAGDPNGLDRDNDGTGCE
jgi:hypothetical protein